MNKKVNDANKLLVASIASLYFFGQSHAMAADGSQPVYSRFQTNIAEQHDRGAYARLGLGAGYAARWSSDYGPNGAQTGSGASVTGHLALGWLPTNQLALHVSGWGVGGHDVTMLGVGPGVTYWFSPASSWYTSIAMGPVTFSDSEEFATQWGVGTEAEIGLMAWIGDHSMLGLSFVAGVEGIDLDHDDKQLESWRVGLRATVAFE